MAKSRFNFKMQNRDKLSLKRTATGQATHQASVGRHEHRETSSGVPSIATSDVDLEPVMSSNDHSKLRENRKVSQYRMKSPQRHTNYSSSNASLANLGAPTTPHQLHHNSGEGAIKVSRRVSRLRSSLANTQDEVTSSVQQKRRILTVKKANVKPAAAVIPASSNQWNSNSVALSPNAERRIKKSR